MDLTFSPPTTASSLLDQLHRQFVINVEHELRTPVAVAQGYAELLSTGEFGTLSADQQSAALSILAPDASPQ